jgi:hypothetical protein
MKRVGPRRFDDMRRAINALLIGCAWLFVSISLIYVTRRGNDLTWQTGPLFWPGSLIAAVSVCGLPSLSSPTQMKHDIDECRNDILVLLLAKFWVAALSNLVLYSGLAYLFLGVLSKVNQKPEGK